ncbi:bifunctional diguanylate cyclase/phosphodiesterase [uncultured Devosia sp.]|uniref:putative bifunctional diguanylate cyclase/phosphodiesterase n=1 Tax=uncultured Devosia sp. TaxID=211434 RepID=UPI0030EE3934|tara:strand:+ start:7278 stop:9497 length:2220 start_codon:yes stop_codon:yes gene_type:complete
MHSKFPTETRLSFRQFALLATIVAAVLLGAVWALVWGAVQRIDGMVLTEEKQAIAAGLTQEQIRLVEEQRQITTRDDAVAKLRTNNRIWIVDNLFDHMRTSHNEGRMYLVAANGTVMGMTEYGWAWGEPFDARDKVAVESGLDKLRKRMADAATTNFKHALAEIGVADLVRLSDRRIAFLSIQPVVGTDHASWQDPGSMFLHVVVRVLDGRLLSNLSERVGLIGLKVGAPGNVHASLAMQNSDGSPLGYLIWTPNRPALKLLLDTAPTSAVILGVAAISIFSLLVWLRRAAALVDESRDQTTFLAFHDPLTGLANRVQFGTSLREAMKYEYLAATKVLLIAIDLDRFKEVNDTLGHAAGDQLLEQVGKRLSQALSDGATLARLAGDEFAIVQPGIVSDGHARWLCQSILQSLNEPFALSSGLIYVTASFGAALEPGDAVAPEEMLRRADVALYAAKAAGSNCFEIYTPDMDSTRREKRNLEVDLRHALICGTGLFLVYQPIFDAVTGKISGAEALVRWLHPIKGHLAPDVFIGIAEETGVIDELGLWVLDEASRFAVASGLPRIAVNVSPVQFLDSQFADHVLQTLHRHELAPSRLELEITEGLLLQNSGLVRQALVQLRDQGVRIALDDFGTGYSSISYLRSHDVDKLKIDQSFTRMMTHDQPTHAIVRSVIEMAHALGMSVTAEGVEDEQQRLLLQQLRCDYLQGYLLSRPLSGDVLVELLISKEPAGKLVADARRV